MDQEGNVSRNEQIVNERWGRDFENLYNCDDLSHFDEKHYNQSKIHKLLIENEMTDPLYVPNEEINGNIS